MIERELVPELMDQPELDVDDHAAALAGLSRINRWTRNGPLAWSSIVDLFQTQRQTRFRLLDVATGAGDIPLHLARCARRQGIDLQIAACDISSQALAAARDRFKRAGLECELFELDVADQPIRERYDVVMCSQFLHHLTTDQALTVLGRMRDAARRRVVVIDLIRSRLNWLQVWLATRVLSWSPIVRFDGPQSVRAAFTLQEAKALAGRVPFQSYAIRSVWPCRFVLTGDVDGRSS
ncbi:MAG: methyltransferase domain-containing protein [bacterium]|nr:methyltransferase domain-containing protein [bacterium]